ncbi:XkdF-like putative serine protease domain-containing protein [Alkalicoccobacillus gibsonii]|uniref:XkdF-like putative serine protease domain-containing protein n=1 Tax=Alkalicoccobacillus gibsonii TaxID=79881 RepID=UPI001932FB9E|nr:XkdF-like putative serine protease domain-containing protein [Alkalicoccobacillus gibsonii]MBM0064937.1 hypothetical protein [Alkalicoccobacillus gibsonii]
MPRELVNAHITHVSYVDKGANQKPFFFSKSADNQSQPTFTKEVKLIRKEDEQQLVYGIVYEPDVEDSHSDYMTASEIEKAAHGFMKDARNIDTQHDFEAGVGEVVESYVAPAEFEMNGQTITKGSWVLVTKANDDIWEQIKKGDITGYSMAGMAETIEKQAQQPTHERTASGFFEMVKSFFSGDPVQKGAVRDRYKQTQRSRNLWAAFDALENEYYESRWDNTTPDVADFEKLKSAAADFLELVSEIETQEDVKKALADKVKKEEEELKPEDLQKAVEAAIQPLNERIAKLEEPTKPAPTEPESNPEDDFVKQVTEAVQKSLEPIEKRISAIEKSRGNSQQQDPDSGSNQQPVQKHFLSGIL